MMVVYISRRNMVEVEELLDGGWYERST